MPKAQLDTLTEQMFYVLLALKHDRNGAEIVEYVRNLTLDRIILGSGTLYAMLFKFEEEEMIIETGSAGRKRWYRITQKGQDMLKKETRRIAQMLKDYEEEGE